MRDFKKNALYSVEYRSEYVFQQIVNVQLAFLIINKYPHCCSNTTHTCYLHETNLLAS